MNQPYYYPNNGWGYQPTVTPTTGYQNDEISVNSREQAYYYPVAPGNKMRFRKEDGSCLYVKTMGNTANEPFRFEEYERKVTEEKPQVVDTNKYDDEISKLWGEINALKTKQNNPQQNSKIKDGGGN